MNTYYQHITTKVKGMISSAFMDLFELKIDFDSFIEYLVLKYGGISESSFDYHVFYENENKSIKDYSHYLTLDNSIYVEVKTCSETEIETDVIDMTDTEVQSVIAYTSQSNNKKLIKFMNDVNSFVIKNKKEKDDV